MSPDRVAGLVARWARLYTRGLPARIAERRIAEIDADLHDHIASERAAGVADRRIALAVASRLVRGLAADAAWRASTPKENRMTRPYVRVAAVAAIVLLVNLVGSLAVDSWNWGVFDYVFAAALIGLVGVLIELALSHPRSIAVRAGAAAIGVAAMVLGESDDAPGLFGFGLLVIAAAVALSLRRPRRA